VEARGGKRCRHQSGLGAWLLRRVGAHRDGQLLLESPAASAANRTGSDGAVFGVSLNERAQRIDITGHAASAFMKSVENRIECPLAVS